MTDRDPQTVARGLTKAQRAAIERCMNDGNEIIQGGQDDSGIKTRVINSLRIKDLLAWKVMYSPYETGWKLNDLGLAVRALLEKENARGA